MNVQKKPKIRYSDRELAEFQHVIDQKMAEAQRAYQQLRDSLDASNDQTLGSPIRDVDDYTDYAEKEHLYVLMARQKRYIQNLQRAQQRIASKTYGICKATGNLIDRRRLMLVPHTTLSAEAKRQRR